MKRITLKEVSKNKTLLLMLLPAVIMTFVFSYLPLGGVVLAFKQFKYQTGIFGSPWVGLDNFQFFLSSGNAFLVTRNTILYNLAFLVVGTFFEILFAILISELASKNFKRITQSMMFLPYFISWVIVASIAYNIFNFEHGALNSLLKMIGVEPVDIYNTPSVWFYLLTFFKVWKGTGYGTIVYLAAIMNIDPEMNEAAEIDGANIIQRIVHITIPCIVPTILILVLLAIGGIFRGDFGLFYQLVGNNGLLYEATDIIDTYVFRALTATSDIGMAAAAGFYQSIMCFVLVMITNYMVKSVNRDYALF